MKIVASEKYRTVIVWVDVPCEGKPLTRVWVGPEGTCSSGSTVGGRDFEIASLLAANSQFGHDWRER